VSVVVVLALAGVKAEAIEPEPPLSVSGESGDLSFFLTIDPPRAGESEVNIFFFDMDGDDRSVTKLLARVTFLDFKVPPLEIELEEAHPGHAFFNGAYFRHPGRWRIEVAVSRHGLPDTVCSFDVTIR
jgi:hypothetical protein